MCSTGIVCCGMAQQLCIVRYGMVCVVLISHDMVYGIVVMYSMVWYGNVQYWYRMAWYNYGIVVMYIMVQYGMVMCSTGTVWRGMVQQLCEEK